MNTYRAIFLNQDPAQIARVFGDGRCERVAALIPTRPGVVRREDLAALSAELANVEIIFSTWGMPQLDAADIARLPRLKAVLYAAGSVREFGAKFLERGIQISSAWRANALPVAEITVAHIILALKQTFHVARAVHTTRSWNATGRTPITGAYGSIVGLIALGATGRRVVELLRPHDLRIIAHDPYAKPISGVEMVGLEEVFQRADVVSLHAPLIPATVGMIRGEHLRLMKPNSTFINTSRGAVVREDEMIQVLRERPDLQAVIDVVHPEPPSSDSALYELPNVLMTPHTAGSAGNEVLRMADWMIEECRRLLRGEALQHAVSLDMLETMT